MPHGRDIWASGIRLALGEHPAVPVLDGVDLHAPAGTLTAVVGPSGCGKSTLLDVLAGLRSADSGEFSVEDDVALMPQRDALMPWLTLRENVAMGAVLAGWSRGEATARADGALARLGLNGFGDHYPHALSGGMRQRGALARTMLADRGTWLLDEPFGALDALTRGEMHRVLGDLRADANPTILLVTHDIAEAIALADHVLVATPRPMRIASAVPVDRADPGACGALVMDVLRTAGAIA